MAWCCDNFDKGNKWIKIFKAEMKRCLSGISTNKKLGKIPAL
jgi:hypothetical protein